MWSLSRTTSSSSWTAVVMISFILCAMYVSSSLANFNEEEEKQKLLAWAESEGLREPILNEEGLPILEVERINFHKLQEYNRKCDSESARLEGLAEEEECQALKGKIVKNLEDMDVDELSDYLIKRKRVKDESHTRVKDEM